VSEFLGNRFDVSDYECDECSLKFSRYETELASYLGIVRTVQSVKGKKMLKFKSADKKMVAESLNLSIKTNVVNFSRYNSLNNTFEFDEARNLCIIHYTKPTYVPLMVYKAVLKIALTILTRNI